MNKKHEWANDLIVMDEWAVQNEIAEKVIELSGINIFEKTRKREVVEIRSLFFFILKDKLNMSWTQIANYFKDSGTYINHATVIHSYNNYEMYKSSNNKMQEIEEMISLKTSMDLKGINKEEYLTLKCKDLEQELDKIKDQALLKIQSLIWEQKRIIKNIEDELDNDKEVEPELIEMQFNRSINKLEVLEFMKKAIQNYEY